MPDILRDFDYTLECKDCIYRRYMLYTLACSKAQAHANKHHHRVVLSDVLGAEVETFTALTPAPIPDEPPF